MNEKHPGLKNQNWLRLVELKFEEYPSMYEGAGRRLNYPYPKEPKDPVDWDAWFFWYHYNKLFGFKLTHKDVAIGIGITRYQPGERFTPYSAKTVSNTFNLMIKEYL